MANPNPAVDLFKFQDPKILVDFINMYTTGRHKTIYTDNDAKHRKIVLLIFKEMHLNLDACFNYHGTTDLKKATLLRYLFLKLYLYEWSFLVYIKETKTFRYIGYDTSDDDLIPYEDAYSLKEDYNVYAFIYGYGNAESMIMELVARRIPAAYYVPYVAPIDDPNFRTTSWDPMFGIDYRGFISWSEVIVEPNTAPREFSNIELGLMQMEEPKLYKDMVDWFSRHEVQIKRLTLYDEEGFLEMIKHDYNEMKKNNTFLMTYRGLKKMKNMVKVPIVACDFTLYKIKLKAAADVSKFKYKDYPKKQLNMDDFNSKVSSKDLKLFPNNYVADKLFMIYAVSHDKYIAAKNEYMFEVESLGPVNEAAALAIKSIIEKKLKFEMVVKDLYKEFCSKGFTHDGVNFRKCKYTMVFLHPELRAVLIKYFTMTPNINPMYVLSSFHACLEMTNEEGDDDLYKTEFDNIIHSRRTINKIKSGVTLILREYYQVPIVKIYEYCPHYADLARKSMSDIKISTKCTYSYIFRAHQSLGDKAAYENVKRQKLMKLASMLSEQYVDLTIAKGGKGAVFTSSSYDVDSLDEFLKKGQKTVKLINLVNYYTQYYATLLEDCLNMPLTESLITEFKVESRISNDSVNTYLRLINSGLFEKLSKTEKISQLSWDQMLYSFHQAALSMSGNLINDMLKSKLYSTPLLSQYMANAPMQETLYYNYMMQLVTRLNEAVDVMNIKKLERTTLKFAEAMEEFYKPVTTYKSIVSSEEHFFKHMEELKAKQKKNSDEADKLKNAIKAKELIRKHDTSMMNAQELKDEKKLLEAMEYSEYRKLRVECNEAVKYVEAVKKMFPVTSKLVIPAIPGRKSDFDMFAFGELLEERNAELDKINLELLSMGKKANPTACEIVDNQKDNKSMAGIIASIPTLPEFCTKWQKVARDKIPLVNYMLAYQCVMGEYIMSRHKLPKEMKRGDWIMLINAMCRHFGKADLANMSNFNMKRVNKFMEKPAGARNIEAALINDANSMVSRAIGDMLKGKYQTAMMFANLQRAKYIITKYIRKYEMNRKLIYEPGIAGGAPWTKVELIQRRSLVASRAAEVINVD